MRISDWSSDVCSSDLNNLLICTATLTVFFGTLYPLLDKTVSVGKPYYQLTFVPLMTPVVVVMVVAPLMAWKRGDLPGVLGRLKFAASGTVLVTLAALRLQDRQSTRLNSVPNAHLVCR